MTEFDEVIPPGGVGRVTASLDTTHVKGSVVKGVRVTTSDPGTPPVDLQLKARVVTIVDVAPTEAPFVRMTAGEPVTAEVTVSSLDGTAFDVAGVDTDAPVDVTVAPAADPVSRADAPAPPLASPVPAGARAYVVRITPRDDVPVGQSTALVALRTTHPRAPRVPIRPIVVARGSVRVVPERLAVFPAPEPPVLHVRVTKPSGAPLAVLEVASSDPDFTATTTALVAGREYDVAVRYTGRPGRGAVSARLTVTTDDARQPEIVIPMYGRL